ncbi:hypothetical protein C5O80_14985 [Burkholderia sp. SRS-46]|nr:hypothetical protein C5O80_14985 [Burkholderia sp. SRS-46]
MRNDANPGPGRSGSTERIAMRARVLIVGDGPAGCAAAIAAARAGCDVSMLGHGRARAAPECVSGAASMLLDGLVPNLAGQSGAWLDAVTDAHGGRAIIRSRLDDALRTEALAARVRYARAPAGPLAPRVEHGTIVGVMHRGGTIDAGIVIDATGVGGWLRRALRLEASADSSSFWLRRGYARTEGARGGTRWHITRDGWLWLRATATYPIWTSLHAVRDDDVPWPDDASPVGPVWRECRRWRCLRRAAGPGYIVCGDAASHLDPATGDGLRFAMASGLRAGALAADVLHHPHRSSVLSALYSDWVVQTYEGNRALLARHYALSGLDIGARDPLLLPDA